MCHYVIGVGRTEHTSKDELCLTQFQERVFPDHYIHICGRAERLKELPSNVLEVCRSWLAGFVLCSVNVNCHSLLLNATLKHQDILLECRRSVSSPQIHISHSSCPLHCISLLYYPSFLPSTLHCPLLLQLHFSNPQSSSRLCSPFYCHDN